MHISLEIRVIFTCFDAINRYYVLPNLQGVVKMVLSCYCTDQVLKPFFIEKIKQCLTRWEFFKIKKEKRILIQLISRTLISGIQ